MMNIFKYPYNTHSTFSPVHASQILLTWQASVVSYISDLSSEYVPPYTRQLANAFFIELRQRTAVRW